MRKILINSVLTLMTVVTLITSRPSEAAIGSLFSIAPVVTLGLVSLSAGGVTAVGSVIYSATSNRLTASWRSTVMLFGVAGPLALVGLVLLENEQGLSYTTLTAEEAQKIGLNEAELTNYNAHIDQVNALVSHVDSEMASLTEPTIEHSIAVWNSVQDSVSPETFSAMQKITAQIYR